jgi:hypothetical protein
LAEWKKDLEMLRHDPDQGVSFIARLILGQANRLHDNPDPYSAWDAIRQIEFYLGDLKELMNGEDTETPVTQSVRPGTD